MKIVNGWLETATHHPSPHCDKRPDNVPVSLLVIHNISLPPGEFGGGHVVPFFTGNLSLDAHKHPFFQEIATMRVSAHCFIDRQGQVMQFVSFDDRAWHAGVSSFQGAERCNDYSIGIELEGTDDIPYTDEQYKMLGVITETLRQQYTALTLGRIVGHTDIAPGRKTDPGQAFDWGRYRTSLDILSTKD